jgi:HlyD family secretion protein
MSRSILPSLALACAALACGRDPDHGLIVAAGHVEATEVRVATKLAGTLASVRVEEGDRVKAGQELARIDTTDVQLALAAARADRGQAEAELRLRRAGARREDVAEADALVQRARADLDGAEKDLERMEGLLASGSGTAKARDDARTRRDALAASVEAARERAAKLRAGSRVEEIDAARARLESAEARIAQLEQQLLDALIASPVSGVVTEKLAETGELATRGTVVAVVSDLGRPWLTVYVAEPDLGRVRVGQEAEVRTDDGQKRMGHITAVASKAEFTPKNVQTRDERVKLVYKLKIGLPNDDGLFKAGMPAEARIRPAGGAQ